MQTTIFIHIGESKTGTSIIQNFLNVNRKKLANELGYLYPNFSSHSYITGKCHNHVVWYSDAIKNGTSKFIVDMNKMINYCQAKGLANIILSNEGWLLNEKTTIVFSEFLNQTQDVNLVIIGYLRRIDTWIESGWKQWGLKVYDSIEEYADTPFVKFEYKAILDHLKEWESLIGKENMIIRPYEKRQLPGGLINDFLSQVGIKFDDHAWNQTEDSNLAKNFGFNRDVLEILHVCSDLYANRHDVQLFNTFSDLLRDKFQKKPFEPYQLLSPKQRWDLINQNQNYEEEIAIKYMGRPDGKIFHDPLPDPDEDWEPYEGLTLEKAIPILVEMIHQEHKNIKQMNQQLIRLTTQNKNLASANRNDDMEEQNITQKKSFFKKLKNSLNH
jgi:hypothetical protein